ncbi:hypothetical protein NDU88_002524, partial [Pleurodeles waltl]
EEEMELTCWVMDSEGSKMNPRLRVWSVGVGVVPRVAGHQESSHAEGVETKMRTSVMLELSLRQLLFIHSAMAFIP